MTSRLSPQIVRARRTSLGRFDPHVLLRLSKTRLILKRQKVSLLLFSIPEPTAYGPFGREPDLFQHDMENLDVFSGSQTTLSTSSKTPPPFLMATCRGSRFCSPFRAGLRQELTAEGSVEQGTVRLEGSLRSSNRQTQRRGKAWERPVATGYDRG